MFVFNCSLEQKKKNRANLQSSDLSDDDQNNQQPEGTLFCQISYKGTEKKNTTYD